MAKEGGPPKGTFRDPPLADVSAKIVRLRPPLRGASVMGASVRYGRRRGLHAPYAFHLVPKLQLGNTTQPKLQLRLA
ncbi:hypothetical protein [Desulfoglaeba alkanexedens]|uniref:Uncharacterized protein n=1 Tax=Desulfoglaeba alkanexedens ALDC TaxID=980445 RepID=A0A4P8KZE6_9BACT|nr:hypothetical protein [Desulfoglaeba alkanexedens]QCQ20909.1 hypothetical protein FDQ92_01060 [Desulfoglaeba alkanexedens ALDC]